MIKTINLKGPINLNIIRTKINLYQNNDHFNLIINNLYKMDNNKIKFQIIFNNKDNLTPHLNNKGSLIITKDNKDSIKIKNRIIKYQTHLNNKGTLIMTNNLINKDYKDNTTHKATIQI